MIVRGVNVFPSQIEEKLLAIEALSAHYQIVLTREGRLDAMEIVVEARPESAYEETRAAAASRLAEAVKDTIGISAKVTVSEPGGVERSVGKVKRVVDKRPRE
jgi:phenylacetate-CoA ligase